MNEDTVTKLEEIKEDKVTKLEEIKENKVTKLGRKESSRMPLYTFCSPAPERRQARSQSCHVKADISQIFLSVFCPLVNRLNDNPYSLQNICVEVINFEVHRIMFTNCGTG